MSACQCDIEHTKRDMIDPKRHSSTGYGYRAPCGNLKAIVKYKLVIVGEKCSSCRYDHWYAFQCITIL